LERHQRIQKTTERAAKIVRSERAGNPGMAGASIPFHVKNGLRWIVDQLPPTTQ
jgi:hypothetical protein